MRRGPGTVVFGTNRREGKGTVTQGYNTSIFESSAEKKTVQIVWAEETKGSEERPQYFSSQGKW